MRRLLCLYLELWERFFKRGQHILTVFIAGFIDCWHFLLHYKCFHYFYFHYFLRVTESIIFVFSTRILRMEFGRFPYLFNDGIVGIILVVGRQISNFHSLVVVLEKDIHQLVLPPVIREKSVRYSSQDSQSVMRLNHNNLKELLLFDSVALLDRKYEWYRK